MTAAPTPPVRVFLVAVAGIAIFSFMDALMKELVLAIGLYTTLFWRTVASCVVSGALYARGRPTPPTRAVIRVHVLRGTVSTVMAGAFFWGLARVPMAQAVALTFIAPLASLYLAAVMLGERVTARMLVASAIALVGVVILLAGQWQAAQGADVTLGSAAILFSALWYAVNIVLMRKQALVAGPLEVAFSQSVVVGVLLAIGAPFFAGLPDAAHVPSLLLAAVLAVVSLMLLAWAYARGEANQLSASEYTAFVWAALFGWMFFGEPLAPATVVGAAFIVVGCAVAARREPTAVVGPEAAP